jgi:FkbM family methyltransferase
MQAFYSRFLAPGDLCFDVGANIGNRVKIFLAIGARVVAVEPQRECARVLETAFAGRPGFALVEKALGSAEGRAEMLISDADTISSLSREWITAVTESGRFTDRRWDRTRVVEVATLDQLVARHGVPAFVKIDVEGFEAEVVRGLSRPVKALSIEYTPECMESTLACIDHLAELGEIELSFSFAESMEFARPDWMNRAELADYLRGLGDAPEVWGDVYVRSAAR